MTGGGDLLRPSIVKRHIGIHREFRGLDYMKYVRFFFLGYRSATHFP